jgi:hypothetical protein
MCVVVLLGVCGASAHVEPSPHPPNEVATSLVRTTLAQEKERGQDLEQYTRGIEMMGRCLCVCCDCDWQDQLPERTHRTGEQDNMIIQ